MYTREQKVKLLWPLIEKGHREGLTVTRMYEQTKGTALGMRKTEFLALAREVLGQARKREAIKHIPLKYAPTRAEIMEKPWRLREKYLIEYRAVLRDVKTGERRISHYSDYVRRLKARGTTLEEGRRLFQEEKEKKRYPWVIREDEEIEELDYAVITETERRYW